MQLRRSTKETTPHLQPMPGFPLLDTPPEDEDEWTCGAKFGVVVAHPQPVGRDYHRFMLGYQSRATRVGRT